MDVEWEDVQAAFLSTRTDLEYFLDRETGEVVSLAESEDEDEEEEKEEGAGKGNEEEENIRLEMENDPDRFVEISPVSSSDRSEWMSAFILTVKQKDLTAQLTKAAGGGSPEREFDKALRKVPAERGRWLGFIETQVQEIIDGWIEENDIESDTQPPWKVKAPRRHPKKAQDSE